MDPLVTVDWLRQHLSDPDMAVLDATLPPPGTTPALDVLARYREQHIPGALFFDIEALSDHATALPHMLPSAEQFGAAMGAMGLRETMTFVVYEQGSFFSAPRAWWTLRTMGAVKAFVLDGGLRAWTAAGLPVNGDTVTRAPAHFAAQLHEEAVVQLPELLSILGSGGQVTDARSAGRFEGRDPEPRPGLPSGHMPGAISLPFSELVRPDGLLKEKEELRSLFDARGLDLRHPVTTTCGSGVTAAALALGLEQAGAEQVRVYDGSWAEYAQTSGVQIQPSRLVR